MARPIILGITGMPASGKSTCAKYIAKKEGVHHIMLSDFIWSWLEKQGIKKTSVTGAMYGLYLHTIYESTPILKWVKKKIKKCVGADVILIDTVRTPAVYEYFRKKYKKRFALVAVVAGPEIRKAREIKRARFGQHITEKGVKMRDAEELKVGVGSVVSLADEYIYANLPKKDMLEQTEGAYKRVLRTLK